MGDLVERLRDDHDMLSDGYQVNLTRAWHDVAMREASDDCAEAVYCIETMQKALEDICALLPNPTLPITHAIRDIAVLALSKAQTPPHSGKE